MSTVHTIKQLEERNVASEIVLMVWSDRMDLVALANVKGEVALHRLTWTKAWNLSPPKDGLSVKAIMWRPDGKIIAVAYSSGQVILVKVENKSILHTIDTKSGISCLTWTQDRVYARGKTSLSNEDSKQNQYMKYIDLSSSFLSEPSLPHFDASNSDENQKGNILQDQSDLNLLLIGTSEGSVHVHVFGCFLCATIDLNASSNTPCCVDSIHLTEGLDHLIVSVRDSGGAVRLLCFDSDIFATHTNELFAVALKHIKLTSLLNYLCDTITTITESWESILLEMDNKLSSYAGKVPEGGVTADFLDLLMFGICSDEMKAFLIHDLTKKGLEKFGQTIEMSYSNIQKLVLKYVMRFGQNVTYHLAELRGMARLEHRYKVLGLAEGPITSAILSSGAFLIKGGEMQQIINHSIVNYKAFFRWLYTAIVHVLEEQVPNEIPKMTQQDLAYIAEFLQNFDRLGRRGFVMERLGQYLDDAALAARPDMAANEWSGFLARNRCVAQDAAVLRHAAPASLVQQYRRLRAAVDAAFAGPRAAVGRRLAARAALDVGGGGRPTHAALGREAALFAFVKPEGVLLARLRVGGGACALRRALLRFPDDAGGGDQRVLDAQLYSGAVLSVLLRGGGRTALAQVPLAAALEAAAEGGVADVDGWLLAPRAVKSLEGMAGAEFAVSGSRKVGIVLAENRRKVRLYEMEGEEEEDEDAEMTNSTMREAEMSVQDVSV